jgi:hypothetical protein
MTSQRVRGFMKRDTGGRRIAIGGRVLDEVQIRCATQRSPGTSCYVAIKKAEMSGYKLPSGLIADNDGIFGKWMEHDFLRYFDIVIRRTHQANQSTTNGATEFARGFIEVSNQRC